MSKKELHLPDASSVGRNTPLRLTVAARLAFPDGSIKLASLRREISRGRLAYEMIANKQYTTLADIEAMRQLCRRQAQPQTHLNISLALLRSQSGSSEEDGGLSPQERLRLLIQNRRVERKTKGKPRPSSSKSK